MNVLMNALNDLRRIRQMARQFENDQQFIEAVKQSCVQDLVKDAIIHSFETKTEGTIADRTEAALDEVIERLERFF